MFEIETAELTDAEKAALLAAAAVMDRLEADLGPGGGVLFADWDPYSVDCGMVARKFRELAGALT